MTSSPSRSSHGLLDTSVLVDLDQLAEERLPVHGAITSVSLAEILQGVHFAKNHADRATRLDHVRVIEAMFPSPIPFDASAARTYATLVALVLEAGRNPRPRKFDLMIAACAASNRLPLFTRNAGDLKGLGAKLDIVAV